MKAITSIIVETNKNNARMCTFPEIKNEIKTNTVKIENNNEN
ncbi:MAG: hypothetical protein PHW03_07115 [Eubacteriales bacterium]|nr:hypothetical protein [Eubacteriales bacterium]